MLVFTTHDLRLTLFLRPTISVSSESSGHCKVFLRSYPVLLNMIVIDLAQQLQLDCTLSSQKMPLLCRYPASCSLYLAFILLLPSHSIFQPRDLYSSHITSRVSTGTLLLIIILYAKPVLIPSTLAITSGKEMSWFFTLLFTALLLFWQGYYGQP